MGVKTGLHAAAERFGRLDGKKLMLQAAERVSRRMLELSKEKTPPGSGKLRAAWQVKKMEETGRGLRIEIENSADYASFVEAGHRQTPERFVPAIGKALVEDYVPGQFFLREAEAQYRTEGGAELEAMLAEKLRKGITDGE